MNLLGLIDLLPRKIRVTLIDNVTGKIIAENRLLTDQLPTAYDKPSFIDVNNTRWRVLKADPPTAEDFLYRKKLMLYVEKEGATSGTRQFLFPTITTMKYDTDNHQSPNISTLHMTESDWGQIEFLPQDLLPAITQELTNIQDILTNTNDALLGYETQHIRNDIAQQKLSIPFDDFCAMINTKQRGNIFIDNNRCLQNGFSVYAEGHCYYGIVKDNVIHELYLKQYYSVDDDLLKILENYGMLMIDWCNVQILSSQ